jgi:hypothetical protein
MSVITIWSPRYHDRKVLIAKYKVQDSNVVKFTKDKRLTGSYPLTRAQIVKYPLESNGTIPCYAVSLDELVDVS